MILDAIWTLRAISQQYMPGCEYLGYDVWSRAVAWAQKTITTVYPDCTFTLLASAAGYAGSNAYDIPIKSGSAELLVAMSLFTHLDFDAASKYFQETHRVLADDGAAILHFEYWTRLRRYRLKQPPIGRVCR